VTTTTPNRGDRDRVSVGDGRRSVSVSPQRPDRTIWRKVVLLLNVALIAGVAIIGLTQLHDQDPADPAVATDSTVGPASTLPDPDATPSDVATTLPSADPAPSTPPSSAPPSSATPPATPPATGGTGVVTAPHVQPRMRANFAKGDGWPYGAGFRETGRFAWPLGVVDGVMTHGQPSAPDSVSWLEKWLKTDIRTIGARVLFAPNHSGAAAITAWHTSVLDTSGLEQPRTGMRLVVLPGLWRLVALDGDGPSVITSGSYRQTGHSATFNLVRRNSTIWLTDPTGQVIRVDDPRIGSLSGPWASWELRDDSPDRRPAGFQEIWAG